LLTIVNQHKLTKYIQKHQSGLKKEYSKYISYLSSTN